MQYLKQEIKEFVDTNLVDIYDDWSPTITYTVETDNENLTNASVVRYGLYYYRSVTEDNLNYNPEEYENIKWVKYEVSNKYALIDMSANTRSSVEGGDMFVTFKQEFIEVLGFGNTEADKVLVEVLDTDGTTVLWSIYNDSPTNKEVEDYWTYIYSPYTTDIYFTQKLTIPVRGEFIKVTFFKQSFTNNSSCGYLVGGFPEDMGKSLMGVQFSYTSYATKELDSFGGIKIKKGAVQDLVDFETVIPSKALPRMRGQLKNIYNEIVLFIIDEQDNSPYESIMTLGVIQDASVLLENSVESIMTFSIMEAT